MYFLTPLLLYRGKNVQRVRNKSVRSYK
jgi:hypothetical protein